MTKLKMIHNPRCSKSRQTLELLNDKGVDVEVIEYLMTPLKRDELSMIASILTTPLNSMVRIKEDEYKQNKFDPNNLEEVLNHLERTPKLLERPIVYDSTKAIIGRPPENVLELLS